MHTTKVLTRVHKIINKAHHAHHYHSYASKELHQLGVLLPQMFALLKERFPVLKDYQVLLHAVLEPIPQLLQVAWKHVLKLLPKHLHLLWVQ